MATTKNETCEDGGWTLVMKLDGNKVLLNYLFYYFIELLDKGLSHVLTILLHFRKFILTT